MNQLKDIVLSDKTDIDVSERKYFSNVFLEGITRKVEISFEVYLDKDNPEENEEILRNGIDEILKIIVDNENRI